jgi:hypothetical protein
MFQIVETCQEALDIIGNKGWSARGCNDYDIHKDDLEGSLKRAIRYGSDTGPVNVICVLKKGSYSPIFFTFS